MTDFSRTHVALAAYDTAEEVDRSHGLRALADAFAGDTAAYNRRDLVVPFVLSGCATDFIRQAIGANRTR